MPNLLYLHQIPTQNNTKHPHQQQKKNNAKTGGRGKKGGGFATVSSAYRVRPETSFYLLICLLFIPTLPHEINSYPQNKQYLDLNCSKTFNAEKDPTNWLTNQR